MKRLKLYLFFVIKLIGVGFHQFTKIIPRQKNKWVFGSFRKGGLGTNSKYLFKEVLTNHPEIKPMWITWSPRNAKNLRKLGYKAYFNFSPLGMYHLLTAKVWIVSSGVADILQYGSGGVYLLNVWHGVGLKKCALNSDLGKLYVLHRFGHKKLEDFNNSFRFKVETFVSYTRTPDGVLVTSKYHRDNFEKIMFNVTNEQCIFANYPRNLILHWSKVKLKELLENEPKESWELVRKIESYSKTYIYMPTWRDDEEDFIKASNIDWSKLDDALRKNNALFICKFHPHTKLDCSFTNNCTNIISFPDRAEDIYPILPFTDCLITDYSSIYTDYIQMDKDVILFTYDLDEYNGLSREMLDYDKYYLGQRANNFEELLTLIETNADCHLDRESYRIVMEAFWSEAFNGVDIAEEVKKRIGMA